MVILIVNGSPTRAVLKAVESGIDTSVNEVEFIDVTKYKLSGCIACYKSKTEEGKGKCVFTNDTNILEDKIFEADTVIFGSPVYW
ncbi:flavodoxin family protein [Fusobacterium sp.]|uniref:flavodoxin family protein n=1 Tax=Fusobacterium sp. TaxID=68766 RepID=UPI002900DC56|nr:flavodoxin family protein [Fusobacterium sp.]MDU1910968.1 flavodoxin family protein [Fusobacterium sp.]